MQPVVSVSRSIRSIACGFEVVCAFLAREEVADGSDAGPQGLVGSGGGFSDEGFQFGESHLDG